MSDGIPCIWMRCGAADCAFFLTSDLPENEAARDRLLLSIMGSPDPRQIDGIGGADPRTSHVAVVGRPADDGAEIECLFLDVCVDRPAVAPADDVVDILSGAVPFALEKGLIAATGDLTEARVRLSGSGEIAVVAVRTPGGRVTYEGEARIDGVPGTAAPVLEDFPEAAGAACGAMLPTGNLVDVIDGVRCTLIDNGMPVAVLTAADMGIMGTEPLVKLDAHDKLKARLEELRRLAGPLMNLGDVSGATLPRMTMISPPARNGAISTRSFALTGFQASIDPLAAVSVATACVMEGTSAHTLSAIPPGAARVVSVEHPGGEVTVVIELDEDGDMVSIRKAAILRTARKLFEGRVFPR